MWKYIIEGIIALIVFVLTAYVIPLIKTKMSAEDFANLTKVIDILVRAAEQMYNSDEGRLKKDFVMESLANRGIEIDNEISAYVEASVQKLHTALYGDCNETD